MAKREMRAFGYLTCTDDGLLLSLLYYLLPTTYYLLPM